MERNKCVICKRETYKESNYKMCKYHYEAYLNIVKAYPEWEHRLNITKYKYLILIDKNPYSGKWVKEVAEHLLKVEKDGLRKSNQ